MPLLDITNPAVIIFLKENYEKENRLRLNWIHKHKQSIQEAATLKREATGYFETDVFAHNMAEGMAAITRDHKVAGYNRRKVPIRDGVNIPGTESIAKENPIATVGLGDPKEDPKLTRPPTDTTLDPKMRPVECELNKVIYKSKPEFGRLEYLRRRNKIKPEKRFYFSECSSWDYGWRLDDSALRQKPAHGRCWHLTKTLKSRVGPQPDPDHYKNPDLPGPTKCV